MSFNVISHKCYAEKFNDLFKKEVLLPNNFALMTTMTWINKNIHRHNSVSSWSFICDEKIFCHSDFTDRGIVGQEKGEFFI